MEISFNVPEKQDILSKGESINVSPRGTRWTKDCLGHYADLRGVYVHHSNNEILYIGQTVKGKYGTFGERLRREFQETASQDSNLYQLLEKTQEGHQIKTACYDLDKIDGLITDSSNRLSKENKALIFEELMIGIFQPRGNKKGIFRKIEEETKSIPNVVL